MIRFGWVPGRWSLWVPLPDRIVVERTWWQNASSSEKVRWIAHELKHVDQWRTHGWMFAAKYAWQTTRYGYRDAPFEVEARAAEVDPAYRRRAEGLLGIGEG